MLNSQPDDQPDLDTDPPAEPRSVEDEWQRLLVTASEEIDQDTAEQITRTLQEHPTLAFGDPTKQQIRTLIQNALDDRDFTEYGISESESARLKNQMRRTLQEGLCNDRLGPISLSTPAHIQIHRQKQRQHADTTANPNPNPNNQSMSDNPDTDTDSNTDTHDQHPAGDTDTIEIDQSEIDSAASESGPGPGPADPNPTGNASAAGAIPDSESESESVSDPADAGGPSSTGSAEPPEIDDDLDVVIARMVLREMQQQYLPDDEDPPERLITLMGKAAELGAYRHQQILRRHLFGHLDENAQDLVFDQTIGEPMKAQLARDIQMQMEDN